ncbi:hypothetical protein FBU59_002630 [Linderina macrospora]|uniref:Uncharacterized protein n=1 Tax=Linderina macrospora TaxID=4868 RepID=A0ACC1JAS0_9FUNG|nr:hypothetical protein FBU59_002630 [Linderina macrospora]
MFFVTTQCVGVILSDEYIITAARCLYDDKKKAGSNMLIRIGYGNSDTALQKMVNVRKVTEHPDYNNDTFENDIAVLQVQKMDLEGMGITVAKVYQGTIESGSAATAIGWGTTDNKNSRSFAKKLKKADVYIGDDDACKTYDTTYFKGTFTSNNGTTICIDDSKSVGNGPCIGDTGGPLVITVDGEQQVAGILSYQGGPDGSTQCAADGGFDFYENLSNQLSFIQSETGLTL